MKYKGILVIKPKAAQVTRKTGYEKMDPYLIINVGPHKLKTKVKHNKHKTPTFDDVFTIDVEDLSDFHIAIWDDDFGKDDFMCETRIPLVNVIAHGKASENVKLYYGGSECGHIQVDLEFKSKN